MRRVAVSKVGVMPIENTALIYFYARYIEFIQRIVLRKVYLTVFIRVLQGWKLNFFISFRISPLDP